MIIVIIAKLSFSQFESRQLLDILTKAIILEENV